MTQLDAALEDREAESADTSTASGVKPKERRKSILNIADMSVAVVEPDGSTAGTFSVGSLPDAVKARCTLIGVWAVLRQSDDLVAAFNALMSGKVPERKVAVPKQSDWKRSIAAALMESMKKNGSPISQVEADAKVATFDRAKLAKAKTDPLVVKHYQKITGTGGLLSLLDD